MDKKERAKIAARINATRQERLAKRVAFHLTDLISGLVEKVTDLVEGTQKKIELQEKETKKTRKTYDSLIRLTEDSSNKSETLLNELVKSNKGLKPIDYTKSFTELQEAISQQPDNTEDIKQISKEIKKSNQEQVRAQQLSVGKLNKVETATRKQVQTIQEQNKILRETDADIRTLDKNNRDGLRDVSESIADQNDIHREGNEHLAGIRDNIDSVYNPEEKAIDVVIKNHAPVVSGGGGGVLPFRNSDNKATEVILTESGNIPESINELGGTVSTNSNSQLRTTVYDEGGVPAEVDNATASLQVIDYNHHEIHAGNHYYHSGYQEINLNETIEFGMHTGATTQWIHLLFDIYGTQQTSFSMYEGASLASGGSVIIPKNNNRNSSNISGVSLMTGASIVGGTNIFLRSVGANKESGFIDRDQEIVLRQDTLYKFVMTSGDDNNTVSYLGEWYEHTDKYS